MRSWKLFLRRWSELGRFLLLSRLLALLPLGMAHNAARWHGRWTYRRRRADLEVGASRMQQQLGAVDQQVEEWLVRYFELAAAERLDEHLYRRMGPTEIGRLSEIRGLENLRTALDRGNGAILYSGHVAGHFTFFVHLGLLGFPLNMIGFPEEFEQWVASRRNAFMEDRLGIRFLRMQRANFGIAVKAVNALRSNEIVTIEIDQAQSRPRLEAEFLGGTGYFPSGFALIAEASGAPLLPFWVHRHETWHPQVAEIGEPWYVSGDVPGAVRHCATVMERFIRSDPPSWRPWLFSRTHVWEPDEVGVP